jgi:hypothetical protein
MVLIPIKRLKLTGKTFLSPTPHPTLWKTIKKRDTATKN